MGFSVSLYAIFDRTEDEICRDLRLRPCGDREALPDSVIAGAYTRSGAYILYVNDRREWGGSIIQPLARTAKLASCTVNETVRYSWASMWNGQTGWEVCHNSDEGLLHIDANGDLPPEFYSIRDEKFALQADAEGVDHIFDIPVELFVASGGIRYDADVSSDSPAPWQPFVRVRRSWWPFRRTAERCDEPKSR